VASIGFTGRFVLQNIPILRNTIMLFHIDTCRLHPARARLYEGRFAVASAGYPLLHQLNEWEIASLFSHAAGPTESTFDGQNLHPQPRYGGRSSRPRSPNLLCLQRIHFQPQFTSWTKVDSMMRSQHIRVPLSGFTGYFTLN